MEHIQRILCPDVFAVKMHELKRKFELLDAKKEDIEKELEYEIKRSCHKRPRKEVENWIANVRKAKPQLEDLERQVSTDGFLRRLLLEGKVEILAREIHELREESKFERGLTLETYNNEGTAFLTKRLIGKAFEKNKRKILDLLLGGEDSIVGVYGMGGVGKTTLITHIHNELLLRPNLNVSWVTVSQNCSIQKLQDDIAKTVCFDISGDEDIRKRAAILANALEKRKNLILILDDVWQDISLLDIGICIGVNVWKLVLTTRSLTICRKINCEKTVKVEPLLEGEAWALFAETLNNDALLSDHGINEIAKSLVRECSGLPLGIVVMAGSMKGVDDIYEWSTTLKEIKEATWSDDMEFHDKVVLVLRYSYDRLKDPKVKECFLYCCLFPEDWKIDRDVLIEYLVDENLIDGRNDRRSAFEKGHTILNKLENVCLLEAQKDDRGKRYVKMHDLVRDMAIQITSGRFLVRVAMQLQDFPGEEEWSEDLIRVSLASNKIDHIPLNTSPNCPKLTTLLLQNNLDLGTLPDNLFAHMKKLTILDLSHTNIKRLPTSMGNLTSLTALLLGGCKSLECVRSLENLTALRRLDLSETSIYKINHIPLNTSPNCPKLTTSLLQGNDSLDTLPDKLFADMKKLTILDLSRTHIKRLPTSMSNLTSLTDLLLGGCKSLKCVRSLENLTALRRLDLSETLIDEVPGGMMNLTDLRHLDLRKCNKLKTMLEGVIPQLAQLEYFRTSDQLMLRGGEVGQLKKLETFCGNFNDISEFNKCLRVWGERRPNNYDIVMTLDSLFFEVGDSFERLTLTGSHKRVRVYSKKEREDTCVLPSDVETIELTSWGNITSLSHFANRDGLMVIHCSVCATMRRGICSCRGDFPFSQSRVSSSNTFSALKSLVIKDCGRLKTLFAPCMFPALQSLERLEVWDCKELVEIVGDDEEETTFTFPTLRTLCLFRLWKLESFCSASSLKLHGSLESLHISSCPELKRVTLLWDEPHPPTSLEGVFVQRKWWDSVEWKHPQTKHVLLPFVDMCYA